MSGNNKKAQNKTSTNKKIDKYLKYALGEIAIVVIGILFVLMANSVKESIQEKEFKMDALQALRNDVVGDFDQFEKYWIPRLSEQLEARNRLSEFIVNIKPIKDSVQFLADIILVTSYYTFNQNSTAIEDLISSNKFSLIDNDSLRKTLLHYKNDIKGVSESDVIHREYFTEIHGRLGPKIVGGTALSEGFIALHNKDTLTLQILASRSLNITDIRESDYLRELLIATGPPFRIKYNGYAGLKKESKVLLTLLDDAIRTEY